MRIIGNRILVSKVEEEKPEGFETVEVADSFIYKGKVEQLPGAVAEWKFDEGVSLRVGDIVLFAKYSPDTHEANQDGKKLKIIHLSDVLAVL